MSRDNAHGSEFRQIKFLARFFEKNFFTDEKNGVAFFRWSADDFPRLRGARIRSRERRKRWFCERKVWTPQGRIPRESGGDAPQGALTESVTEKKPPARKRVGKGEMAR